MIATTLPCAGLGLATSRRRILAPHLVAARKYLEQCLAEKIVPGVQQLMAALLPWAVVRGLVVPSADPPPMSMSVPASA